MDTFSRGTGEPDLGGPRCRTDESERCFAGSGSCRVGVVDPRRMHSPYGPGAWIRCSPNGGDPKRSRLYDHDHERGCRIDSRPAGCLDPTRHQTALHDRDGRFHSTPGTASAGDETSSLR